MDEIRAGTGLVGSLNGTWERARRLFRMQYGGDLPKGITPVWIAGDVREPMGQSGAYRRFVMSFVVAIPAGSSLKIRPTVDVVVEHLKYTFSGGTPSVRLASPAETAALDPAGWTALTATNCVWRDSPDASGIPVEQLTSAGVAGGAALPASLTGQLMPTLDDLYLPGGSSVQFYSPAAVSTVTAVLQGYVRTN